jgi:hypothetical protein
MNFKEFLIESEPKIVYHGDNFGLTNINSNYDRMFSKDTNVQEGIGIYFANDLKVAEGYGSKVVQTKINITKLIPSRGDISKYITKANTIKFFTELNKNTEDFWYLLTNYGMEVQGKEDVSINQLGKLYDMMKSEEVRNFQIEVLQACVDTEVFVKAWLKNIKKYGTYNSELGFYALMYNYDDITTL